MEHRSGSKFHWGQGSLLPNLRGHPLMDLPGSGRIRDITLRGSAHIDLVDLRQKLLGLWRMSGRWVISHAVKPTVPKKKKEREKDGKKD